ncbi:hypothetical protein TNCV_1179171 [Trichonephila clavipes]|nr:hypothetical protein TNCV_1179171 [Trichonephila clavipes]
MLYHRMVLEPHTAYPIPAGARSILLTIPVTPDRTTPQPPVQLFLTDPPQPPVQIFLPDPPVVETLDRPLRTTLQ